MASEDNEKKNGPPETKAESDSGELGPPAAGDGETAESREETNALVPPVSGDGETADSADEPDAPEPPVSADDETRDSEDATKVSEVSDSEDRSGEEAGHSFPVVGIGASAGGLAAFRRFLNAMPADSGMAFVLIQHLDPDHESMMADLLTKYTEMPVRQADEQVRIQPNHVYMIPPNKFLKIADGGLFLEEPVKQRGVRMPIDHFFRSLAEDRGQRAVGVILSGTASDGSIGIKEIKAAGGMTMVQRPDSAEYDGMPRNAVATRAVDFVASIEEMPDILLKYADHPYLNGDDHPFSLDESEPDQFRNILNLLRAYTDYDFRCYKKTTLTRRIQRRMGLKHIESLSDYLKLLRKDGNEVRELFRDLLIGVTRFFRDKEAFALLEDEVVVPVIQESQPDETIRVWNPGCATGEEAYSLGILFFHQAEKQKKKISLQIFATDLDDEAVETGRSAVYPGNIAADIPPARLKRFFQQEEDRYRVNKRLRESIIFAAQNLISDPPFSKIDLIVCRNVLIYLETEVQRKLIQMFHFALREGGYLFLGNSESVGKLGNLFTPVSSQWRVYQKREGTGQNRLEFPIQPATRDRRAKSEPDAEARPARGPSTMGEQVRQLLLSEYAPPAVVVNSDYQIQYQQGRVRDFLDMPSGEPTHDLLDLALPGMPSKIRGLLHQAMKEKRATEGVASRVRRNGDHLAVRIRFTPIHPRRGGPLFLVTFREEPARKSRTEPGSAAAVEGEAPADGEEAESGDLSYQQLQYELKATREDLQSTIEELETSNEELKASNEEALSTNEELQSTNEEMETSREELQSLNEELSTVNNQLEEKVEEVEAANNDLSNLLTSTEIATVFLDTELRIRRFTAQAGDLLKMIPGDVGRPISDLAPRVNDPELVPDAKVVLAKLIVQEREVANEEGRWFVRRILPYRTTENRIEGVVVTLTDVTRLKETGRRLEIREQQQSLIADLGRVALAETGLDELLKMAVDGVRERLGADYSALYERGERRSEIFVRAGDGWKAGEVVGTRMKAGLDSEAGYALEVDGPVLVADLDRDRKFRPSAFLGAHEVASLVCVPVGREKERWGALAAFSRTREDFSLDDVHFLQSVAHVLFEAIQHEIANRRLRESKTRLDLALDAAKIGTWEYDLPDDKLKWNEHHFTIMGYEPDGVVPSYSAWRDRVHPGDLADVEAAMEEAQENRTLYDKEYRVVWPDGTVRWVLGRGVYRYNDNGEAVRMHGVLADVTGAKEAELRLARSEQQFRDIFENAGVGIAHVWPDGRFIRVNERLAEILGYDRSELEKSRLQVITHPEDWDSDHAERERMFRQESPGYTIRQRWYRKAGDLVWTNLTVSCVFREDNETADYCIAIVQDITRQVEAEEALNREEENKNEFLALLGHELRNPLAAVLNATQAMTRSETGRDREKFLDMIRRQSAQMQRLVDELLDISRLSRGLLQIQKETISLDNLISEVLETQEAAAREAGHFIQVDLPDEPVRLEADFGRLVQVFSNLLDNAIRFTEPGKPIRVNARADEKAVEIHVVDSGAGMSRPELDNLFAIYATTASRVDSRKGLGLGLPLAYHIVDLHGGTLTAHSDGPGTGADFAVRLPLGNPRAKGERAAESGSRPAGKPGRSRRILLAEDNEDLAESLANGFRAEGHAVTIAANGDEAIALGKGNGFDVAVIDIGLPGKDGIEVALALEGRFPMMGITGYSHLSQADQSRLKVFAEILVKPVTAGDLAERMDKLPDESPGPAETPGETGEELAEENAREAAEENPAETAGETQEESGPYRILVVDDNVVFAESFVILWRRMGHDVEMALDGAEALAAARRFRPDVVFCDLKLPGGMDGYEVCRKIKAEEPAPVMIALTGYSEEDVAEDANAAGFDEVAGKLCEAEELEEMMERHLGGKPNSGA